MYRDTLCGRWDVDEGRAEREILKCLGSKFSPSKLEDIRRASVVKPPSLRYVDPAEVKSLIDQRKSRNSRDERCKLVAHIHEARRKAKEEHKSNLVELARQGDRRVISFLKRSAAASATDAGFLQRAGGAAEARASVADHCRRKYTATDPTSLPPAHSGSQNPPFHCCLYSYFMWGNCETPQ